jgi:DnaJ-class molecular chaperone
MRLTPEELAAAKRALARLIEESREDGACSACRGQGQVESGIAIDGPESMGGGHACFAPCPECAGTGRGEYV